MRSSFTRQSPETRPTSPKRTSICDVYFWACLRDSGSRASVDYIEHCLLRALFWTGTMCRAPYCHALPGRRDAVGCSWRTCSPLAIGSGCSNQSRPSIVIYLFNLDVFVLVHVLEQYAQNEPRFPTSQTTALYKYILVMKNLFKK